MKPSTATDMFKVRGDVREAAPLQVSTQYRLMCGLLHRHPWVCSGKWEDVAQLIRNRYLKSKLDDLNFVCKYGQRGRWVVVALRYASACVCINAYAGKRVW